VKKLRPTPPACRRGVPNPRHLAPTSEQATPAQACREPPPPMHHLPWWSILGNHSPKTSPRDHLTAEVTRATQHAQVAKAANTLANQVHRHTIQTWAMGSNDQRLQDAVQAAAKISQDASLCEQEATDAETAAELSLKQYIKNYGNGGPHRKNTHHHTRIPPAIDTTITLVAHFLAGSAPPLYPTTFSTIRQQGAPTRVFPITDMRSPHRRFCPDPRPIRELRRPHQHGPQPNNTYTYG
jgi:hypothetical protein